MTARSQLLVVSVDLRYIQTYWGVGWGLGHHILPNSNSASTC